MLTATHLYDGLPDYWGGDGDRWDDNKGCLFSHYSTDTTLHDLVDGWINDWNMGGDCDSMPESIGEKEVRAALLAMLTDEGRTMYGDGSLAECSITFAEANGIEPGQPEIDLDNDEDYCGNDPVAIVLLEYEK